MDLQNVNVEKKPTNTISKFVYGIVLALWIFTSIYAFSSGNLNDTQRTEDSIFGSNKIFQVLHKNRLEFVFKAFVCAFFSLLFIWALKFVKPLFFYFAIGCFSVLMLSGFYLAFTNFGYILNLTVTLPLAFLYTLIFLTVLYALKNVGIDSVCKTIRDSCKAILFYRESVTIVIVFQCLLIVASVLFLATHSLLTSLEPSYFHVLLHLVNGIGFLWTFFLIKDLANLVLSSAFYAWHQNQEKMLLSPSDVHDKVLITLKTYFGTACYGSSIMSIFCQLSTIITTSIRMIRDESYKKAHPVVCVATIYLIVLPNVFTSITYPMTVLYGYDFFESTKKAYDLVIKKTLKFLTSTFIPQLTAVIGCVFIIIALIISHYTNALFGASSDGYKNEEEMYRMKIILSVNILTIVLPLFYVLYTAACSITMYSLENEKIRDTYENTSSA